MMNVWDVAIIGGGPAGLSAALVLGRALRSVVIIDEDNPRNGSALSSHGYLTRDGVSPSAFRELGREDLRAYELVRLEQDTAEKASKEGNHFHIATASGKSYISKYLIVATGARDQLPPIPGIRECYGISIFPCPYCDGWEHRGEPLAVIGSGPHLFDYVRLIFNWSRDLIVFADGASMLTLDQKQALQSRGISLLEQPIKSLYGSGGQLQKIVLEDGQEIARRIAFLADTGARDATGIPDDLGVEREEDGQYETLEHGSTRIDGLYIIGDAKHYFTGLVGSASEGYEAGVAINRKLVEEDWV
ncbi:NAD(P)/FAD-dependent oxidoreductase [Paenibacillus sp. 1011MAR3C5]|uniref:NAD(P)/FAD-dependent oxidoreductase n=1 Tax=Paenibacillus sp. 1011MAR3C5 TaxID=1675787 RepID=UPI000E6CBC9C|nr:NAD(P)/FAD-dependent oxidoreductase [Paenibacillus sp. 1011MAR3C5]RJE90238.1 NAD(P)/FAD-dependent oxidoreductase [Paenibacillus sp. 1011MAR3C5]